jgi:hypothetical protein
VSHRELAQCGRDVAGTAACTDCWTRGLKASMFL